MFYLSIISRTILSLMLFEGALEPGMKPAIEPAEKTMAEVPRTNIVWHWEDRFSPGETIKIESWLNSVTNAVEETLGAYPFDLHFYIYRRSGSREPEPS